MKLITDLVDKLLAPAPQKYPGVMGIFEYVDDVAAAVRALRHATASPASSWRWAGSGRPSSVRPCWRAPSACVT